METNARPAQADVLIVEDSRTQAARLQYILERHGYPVSMVGNGRDALTWLATHQPLLVISDINMPYMSGYDLCRAIKTDLQLAHIPVILLTSLTDPADVVRGLECRADNFITKPYDETPLLTCIAAVLARRDRPATPAAGEGATVVYGDQAYQIPVSHQHMLDLLLTIYDMAVQKNTELLRTRDALAQANAELHEIAVRDGLTGLYNRRELDRLLQEEVARHQRYGHPAALVLLDIDHFKAVNDTYGHQVGDDVLRWIGQILRANVRTLDRPARYGGEEFAIILTETTSAQAGILAEQVRIQIATQPFTWVEGAGEFRQLPLTVSLGVAALAGGVQSAADLIAAADHALYEAKHSGRNRVVRAAERLDPLPLSA